MSEDYAVLSGDALLKLARRRIGVRPTTPEAAAELVAELRAIGDEIHARAERGEWREPESVKHLL